MSFNAFDGVKLSTDMATAFVDGHTNSPFQAARIEAAIIDVADEGRRLQNVIVGTGPDEPIDPGWTVPLEQSTMPEGKEPFAATDTVLVVGTATSTTGEVFVWGGVVRPPHQTVIAEVQISIEPGPDK